METLPVALYYPHARLQSPQLLKTALLLWDYIECIAPPSIADTRSPIGSRDQLEAEELVVRPRAPTEQETFGVHEKLMHLLADGVPPWIYAQIGDEAHHLARFYELQDEKLPDITWEILGRYRVAQRVAHRRQHRVPEALALFILSLLADECAGTTRLKVTDRTQAYSALLGTLTATLGGQFLPNLEAVHLSSAYDRLVTIALTTVNASSLPLRSLVRLRRREAKESSQDLRRLRLSFLQRTTAYTRDILAPGRTAADQKEVLRQYRKEMEADVRDLKRELGMEARKVLFSKEIGVTVLALAGAALAPGSAPVLASTALKTIGVGALFGLRDRYRRAYRDTLRAHPMSWLYLT